MKVSHIAIQLKLMPVCKIAIVFCRLFAEKHTTINRKFYASKVL